MPFFGVPIRNGLPIGLGSVAGFGVQQFDPSQLFEGGTVAGAWYDPSDLSTMFTTSAGTTPVAMPGLGAPVPVGLMLDKSQGLVLGSEQITNGTFDSGTGWALGAGWTISGGAAACDGSTQFSQLEQTNAVPTGRWYRVALTVISAGASVTNIRIVMGGLFIGQINISGAGFYSGIFFNSGGSQTFGVQTQAGTGAAFAVSIDNVSVRELPGNHAISFNNTTARPELRARVNLLTYSEEFDNGAWTKSAINPFGSGSVANTTATLDPLGGNTADYIQEDTASSAHSAYWTLTSAVSAATYTYSIYVKSAGQNRWLRFNVGNNTNSWFNPDTGLWGTVAAGYAAGTPENVGNGWWRVSLTGVAGAATVYLTAGLATGNNNTTYLGTGSAGLYFWGADLRPANIGANVPAYQRIADANTYDTSGFPLYLRFDGIDDSMYTPANLNLSGTDKVAVFAGVRKLSDATRGMLTELSAVASNPGTFYVAAPDTNGAANYGMYLDGPAFYQPVTYPSPITNVLAVLFDRAGTTLADKVIPRINGVINQSGAGTNTASGSFGTYPLYIGSRANSSLWFNGHLHSLIIAGSAVSAGNISATEQYIANKTGIAL